jgi:hypothetical protein
VDNFILTEIGGDNTCQSTNVKSCVQNNSTRVIDHNYINTGRTFNRSERLDSYENEDENCSLDYFISTEIGGDNTCQCTNVKLCVQNNSTRVIGHTI